MFIISNLHSQVTHLNIEIGIEYIVHASKNGLLYDLTSFGACVDEYDISTHQLRAVFTYWCHVCWLRFQRYNLSRRYLSQHTST